MNKRNKLFRSLLIAAAGSYCASLSAQPVQEHTFIVQADNVQTATQAVIAAGGAVKRELGIIRAVSASLSEQEAKVLRTDGLRVTKDQPIRTDRKKKKDADTAEKTESVGEKRKGKDAKAQAAEPLVEESGVTALVSEIAAQEPVAAEAECCL